MAELYTGEIEGSQLTRMQASMNDGIVTMTRRLYYKDALNASEIFSHNTFPKVYSAHPNNATYKFTGNAQVAPLNEKSRTWYADLEYSNDTTGNAGGGGTLSGEPVTSDTAPWELAPEQINFTYPEITVPFEYAYDASGNATIPVQNTAGDPYAVEKPSKITQMSFTFATKNWNINNTFDYGNTINASQIKICNFTIKAKSALLYGLEPSYMTVYDDSGNIKWQYWQVNVTMQIDNRGRLFSRELLNLGDRMFGEAIDLSDDALIAKAREVSSGNVVIYNKITSGSLAGQICHFRKFQYTANTGYAQSGDLVFCTWEQYLVARQIYLSASKLIKEKVTTGPYMLNSVIDLQCEQDTQMPLDANGYLDTKAIKGHPDYVATHKPLTNKFPAYKPKNWRGLNLPSRIK